MRSVLAPPLASLAGLLVGLWLLVPLGLGVAVLAGHLLTRLLRSRRDHRHPQQAAIRERTRQARRLAAEWPLLAPRPSASATGTSGPASTATRPPSSRSAARA